MDATNVDLWIISYVKVGCDKGKGDEGGNEEEERDKWCSDKAGSDEEVRDDRGWDKGWREEGPSYQNIEFESATRWTS